MIWILVNYNNIEQVNALIERKLPDIRFIVVDNSRNYSPTLDETVIVSEENRGYINGLQKGIEYCVKEGLSTSNVIFSNSDIDFDTKEFYNFLEGLTNSKCLYVPSITTLDGRCQNPHFVQRPSKHFWIIRKIFSKNKLLWKIFSLLRIGKLMLFSNTNVEEKQIYAGHGSFMVFKGLPLEKLIDNQYNFLYGEEIHIAEFVVSSGGIVVYDSNFRLTHFEHVSTGTMSSNQRVEFFNESYKYILDNYY